MGKHMLFPLDDHELDLSLVYQKRLDVRHDGAAQQNGISFAMDRSAKSPIAT